MVHLTTAFEQMNYYSAFNIVRVSKKGKNGSQIIYFIFKLFKTTITLFMVYFTNALEQMNYYISFQALFKINQSCSLAASGLWR